MYILNYFKNAVKTKNIKAFIYIAASVAINIVIFWAIYEKLFRQPNGILYGVVFYIICFLILSTPIYRKIGKTLVEGKVIKGESCCPKTRELFERLKDEYVKAGFNEAKNIKLTIYDEAYYKETTDAVIYGGGEICINALADSLPEETNKGRLALAIDMLLQGHGGIWTLPTAFNPFYLAFCYLFAFIRSLSAKFWKNTIFKTTSKMTEYENEMLTSILMKWITFGSTCLKLKYNDSFFEFMLSSPSEKEKADYIDSLN